MNYSRSPQKLEKRAGKSGGKGIGVGVLINSYWLKRSATCVVTA